MMFCVLNNCECVPWGCFTIISISMNEYQDCPYDIEMDEYQDCPYDIEMNDIYKED